LQPLEFRQRYLPKKMGIGFGVLILFAAIMSYVGWSSLSTVNLKVEIGDDANRIVKDTLNGRRSEKNYMLRADEKYLTQAKEIQKAIAVQTTETIKKLKVDLFANLFRDQL